MGFPVVSSVKKVRAPKQLSLGSDDILIELLTVAVLVPGPLARTNWDEGEDAWFEAARTFSRCSSFDFRARVRRPFGVTLRHV